MVNVNLHHQHPYLLNPPRPLTETEILRLVPAIDPFQSLLVVCSDEDLPNPTGKDPLVIWGLLKQGFEWWRHVTGRQSGAACPPNYLTITSRASGHITVTYLGHVLVRLMNGHILGMPLGDISQGTIGDFLKPAAEQLYLDVVQKLNVSEYDQSADSDHYPHQQYYRVLSNIINLAHEKRHGATFVILPDDIDQLDPRLRDRINLKYVIEGVGIWHTLVEESIANRQYHRLLIPEMLRELLFREAIAQPGHKIEIPVDVAVFLTEQADAKPKDLQELIRWHERLDVANNHIREFENFVASLSGIDGCVVLTARLRVLGFGGEILAQSPSLTKVKVAHDPFGHETKDELISSFGTRHRSAFRICSSFEDSVSFVLSQDGGIKAIRRVGPDLILWPDVNMGDIDL